MGKKIRTGILPVLLGLIILCVGCNIWWQYHASREDRHNLFTTLYIMTMVKLQYYRPVQFQQLWGAYWKTGSIPGMLAILHDPYTRFLTKADYDDLRKETEGVFGGIGIYLMPSDSELVISSLVKGSPSERAGLLPGDRIVTVERTPIRKIGISAALSKMKGPPGTQLRLGIERYDQAKRRREIDLVITRDNVHIPTVLLEWKNDRRIGTYAQIKLTQFADTTLVDLKKSLRKVSNNPSCRGLILDLRGNPGGELDAAIGVASSFLPAGAPILHIMRRGHPIQHVTAEARERSDLPMVVLVDKWSASAAEIVAGALKDQKRATLVGTDTFGKDLIQQIVELPQGEALAVTVASYLTAGRVNIHKKGVRPDWVREIPGAFTKTHKQGDPKLFRKMQQLQEESAVQALQKKLEPLVDTNKVAS